MSGQLILSLFPGVDLLGHAFEQEWPDACIVRGPDPIFGSLSDIRSFHPPAERFDGVTGGPPCQSFSSLVHLVRANGHEPKFGNLIPEFERCVAEAAPAWFLMENVPQARTPTVPGYGVKSFLLDNSALDGGDGFGLEQRRVRRFSFGMRGWADADVPSLLRWIDLAVFLLPDACGTVSQWSPDNTAAAKTRKKTLTGGDSLMPSRRCTDKEFGRVRRQAVLTDPHPVPVAIGGSGERKPGARVRQVAVTSTDGGVRSSERKRSKAVSSSNGGNGSERKTPGAGNSGKCRYRFADACRLQGLPEDFLKDAPFTAEGKLKAVANGVPIPMGRAIARAVKDALRFGLCPQCGKPLVQSSKEFWTCWDHGPLYPDGAKR